MACSSLFRIAAVATFALLGACGGDDAPPPAAAPVVDRADATRATVPQHVLVLTLDTLRADRLGCHGNPRGLTPNLDRIAREGVRFARAFASMPCTAPSHLSLFTGLSPRFHGVTNNFTQAPDRLLTLAELLSASGFATGAFLNAFDFRGANLVQGFDVWGVDRSRRAERILPGVENWLAATPGRRRFGWVHFFIAHGPFETPPEFESKFVTHAYAGPLKDDFETLERIRSGELELPPGFAENYRDRYDAAVAFLDAKIGELLALLEARQLLDSTLLVVCADHGESLEGDVIGLHSPVIRDATLHVPLLVRGPGVARGAVVDEVVRLLDVLPTVLARVGLPIPGELEGRDLSGFLGAGTPPEEWSGEAISTLPTRFQGKDADDAEAAAIRRGRYKLVLSSDGTRRLHDLESDPEEARDVAGEHPDVVRALEHAFEQWVRAGAQAGGSQVSPEMVEQLRKLGYQ